jgi:hypothetical protein
LSEFMCCKVFQRICASRLRVVVLLVICAAHLARGQVSQILTNADPGAVAAAIQGGGTIKLAFDGVVKLSNTLVIASDTTVDAGGHVVALDGGKSVRIFTVSGNVSLRLMNLTLTNGRFSGAQPQGQQASTAGLGGCIYSDGGTLGLTGCKFIGNEVTGGDGGDVWPLLQGASAFGGVICAFGGSVGATNCVFVDNRASGGNGGSYTTVFGTGFGTGGEASGGAIWATNCVLSLSDVTIERNAVVGGFGGLGNASGGAIYVVNSVISATGVTMRGNTATGGGTASRDYNGGVGNGGAICEVGVSVGLTNCVFVGNKAAGINTIAFSPQSGAGMGGAISHTMGTVSISGTLFEQNIAVGGRGTPEVNSFLTSADGMGGAISTGAGTMQIQGSAFISNQGNGGDALAQGWTVGAGTGSGGAIYNAGSQTVLTLINCTVAGNMANGGVGQFGLGHRPLGGSAFGGAIYGSVSLINATLAGNSATVGEGGVYDNYAAQAPKSLGSSICGDASLVNSILACAAGQTNVSGTIRDDGHNLCSDSSANLSSPSSRNNVDPLLAPLSYNGGPTPTMALLLGSPAIDIGDDSKCPVTDQRGARRPEGFHSDIGAFELGPKVTLTYEPEVGAQLHYQFLAGITNRITASQDLMEWSFLGNRVSDSNGRFEFEDQDSAKMPWRFYQVEAGAGR